jgi:hypothetical protein
MSISDGQKRHFDTFGFLLLKGALSADEVAEVSREAGRLWESAREGRRFGEPQVVAPFVEHSPMLTKLVEDDRIYGTIERLMGETFVWAGSEGNVTAHSSHGWHSDRPGEVDYLRVKVNIYLDAVTEGSGCLRVLPGSHRLPYHTELAPLQASHSAGHEDLNQTEFGVKSVEIPGVPLETEPGDFVLFNQCLYHSVFNGFAGRRYIALKFAAVPATNQNVARLAQSSEAVFNPIGTFADSASPRVRSMVEPLHELAGRNGSE